MFYVFLRLNKDKDKEAKKFVILKIKKRKIKNTKKIKKIKIIIIIYLNKIIIMKMMK